MTRAQPSLPPADRGSPGWRLFFAVSYRLLRVMAPVIRAAWRGRLPGTSPLVELHLTGRRTGRSRATLVTLLVADDRRYVGHPNGGSQWTRNLEAAGTAVVTAADGTARRVRPVPLRPGPEREAVIRATWSQQPFPANVAYALAREHIRRVGVYFRLDEADVA